MCALFLHFSTIYVNPTHVDDSYIRINISQLTLTRLEPEEPTSIEPGQTDVQSVEGIYLWVAKLKYVPMN